MQLKMFTIHDSKAEVCQNPFYLRTTGEAIRGFADAVNNPETMISRHPEDFRLFELGTFDPVKCEHTLLQPCNVLGCGLDYKKQ